MTRSKATALGVVLVGLTALPAAAEEAQELVCGVHQDVLEWFKHSYRETPVSIGLAANGAVIEYQVSVIRTDEPSRAGRWI